MSYEIYLKKISRINIELISWIFMQWDSIVNSSIFGSKIPKDIFSHKKNFFSSLNKKEWELLKIQAQIQWSQELEKKKKQSLQDEVFMRLQKIFFVKSVYDIEAQKINPYIIPHTDIPYSYFNTIFFWSDAPLINTEKYISQIKGEKIPSIFFSRKQLQELIEYSHSLFPEVVFQFWNYQNMSHKKGVLLIPERKKYSIQNIITLFFHELTHFFRWYNGERNLGFRYSFWNYSPLEEGIAIYNEYFYWNKIINYGSFIPYYDICLSILQKNISEQEKKDKIYWILSHKNFSRKKSDIYYYRFYRYTPVWGKELFLKDAIYSKGYKQVKKLLKEDPTNYEKILSGHIGFWELKLWIMPSNNNVASKEYFLAMTKKIKSYINKK